MAVLASGCGGGAKSNGSAASSTTAGTAATRTAADKALFTYAACMRGKGVNIPDPVRGANGRYAFPQIPAKVLNAAGVRAKARACAAKLPQRTFRQGSPPSAAQRAAFQKFSDCMRAHGAPIGRPGAQPGPPPAGATQGTPSAKGRGTLIVPGGATGPGGRGFFDSSDPKVQAALTKCRKLLPGGFRAQGTG